MKKSKLLEVADRALEDATKKIRVVHFIEPINIKDEKEKFLKGEIKNPRFSYLPLDYHPDEIDTKLLSLRIPPNIYESVYRRKIMRLLAKNRIVQLRGLPDVRHLSEGLYSAPDEELVAKAENIIKRYADAKEEKIIDCTKVMEKLEEAFENLEHWEIKNHKKHTTFTDNANSIVYVNKNRKFSKKDPERLVNHEIMVHVYRYENGRNQPTGVYSGGFPNYLPTEEGLAVLAEEVTGTLSAENLKNYAGRVIAVDSVAKEYSFGQTFEKLKSYNLSDHEAWDITLRAHRGGGYMKDHVYLSGYYKVKQYVKDGGDLEILYVGKVGLQHIPRIEKLLSEEKLVPPLYFPDFFRKPFIQTYLS